MLVEFRGLHLLALLLLGKWQVDDVSVVHNIAASFSNELLADIGRDSPLLGVVCAFTDQLSEAR